MTNPEEQINKVKPTPPPSDPIEFWKDSAPGYEHVHMLKTSTFDSIVGSARKALVMFYAPWCGHCKHAKPAFASAAAQIAINHQVTMIIDEVEILSTQKIINVLLQLIRLFPPI